jgi:hypothetical protein
MSTSNSPVDAGTVRTGTSYVTPTAKHAETTIDMPSLLSLLRLNPDVQQAILKVCTDVDTFLCHTGNIPDIQKALSHCGLSDMLSDFALYTIATKMNQVGRYLMEGFPFSPDLTYLDVHAKVLSADRARGASGRSTTSRPTSPSSPTTIPSSGTSDSSGTKLMKIFDKSKWDKQADTYPEWKERIQDRRVAHDSCTKPSDRSPQDNT